MSSSSESSSDSGLPSISAAFKRKRIEEHESDISSSSSSDSEHGASDVEESEDAPVLSHAQKRRQKKERDNTAELPPSKIPKRQNSVWVGNLSFKTTPESLRAFFDGVGEITRVHMPMKLVSGGPDRKGARKENRGSVTSHNLVFHASSLSPSPKNPLDGRRLLIKDGDDFDGRPVPLPAATAAQKILRAQKQPPGPTLFLGNLGFETSEQSIREMLDSHRAKDRAPEPGEPPRTIRKVRMGTFEDSGKCKGWAFVDFTTTEHATAALTNPKNYFLDGRKLVVEYASPEAVRRGGAGPRPERVTRSGPRQQRPKVSQDTEELEGQLPPDETPGDRAEEEDQPMQKPRRTDNDSRTFSGRSGKFTRTRTKPGAALAQAKRESAAIVPSQGRKIVF
ncbi:Nucleolar protein 13 [Grifola frondosa]|uniref:Nucleolar protein 13 n=1 Tax=Grifola frondosa TaxID=5627 RepID=A0A1C7M0G0_GRIFR|nr:Nucleolar protein 13 [Grifola frondosa]